MLSVIEETFELMDIMRYIAPIPAPLETSESILKVLQEYTPTHLFDVYLLASGIPIRGLLHPGMYPRILKGWLKIGSIVRVMGIEGDMIMGLESTGEYSNKDLTKIKKEIYITLPNPIYNPNGYYMPLLSDEGYMKWDRRWKRYLERYSTEKEDKEILLVNSKKDASTLSAEDTKSTLSGKTKTPHLVVCDEGEEGERTFAPKAKVNRVGYKNAQHNTISGRVILKSKLFTFSSGGSFPLFFSFIILTVAGLVKVYVWKLAVRKFFCVKEGDYVVIRGFKIKRRPGALLVADRTNTDSDTKYACIPEISVNLTGPTGYIMEIDSLPDLPDVSEDPEFTTVVGRVEYISSILRYRECKSRLKFRDYVYLKISGIVVMLLANGADNLLDIQIGKIVEIRHLRKGEIGSFEFYISSLYTQFCLDRSSAPLFDKYVITGEPSSVVEENAVGYIPVRFSAYADHVSAANGGIGVLCINNKPIPRESPDSAYIKKDRMFFGELKKLACAKEEIQSLCMDEQKRFIICGKLSAFKYQSQGDKTIGDTSVDISYIATETGLEYEGESETDRSIDIQESMLSTKIEENIVIRICDDSDSIDIQLFQNHLVHETFEESVLDFLKIENVSGSIYDELSKLVGNLYYVVFDAIRVEEEVVLHVGVSLLR
ncbi:hypothetical protein NEPAR06_1262 [Nematocida parisii]|nr:hypothetical protein NEPAR06_1262 [Nematocida parisii]KAI5158572.1 hypothetical protein NEPAR05_2105 [Nematocida parisii]